MAVRLARLGVHVTLLDSSPEMLDLANRAAREAGLRGSIALQEGDASQAANLFCGECFDVILCHNVLEFVEDPRAVLRSASQVMRDGQIVELERELGNRPEFAAVARYAQLLVRRTPEAETRI
jgi:S-adenosylmethionine-dependent methyltransferase